MKSGRSQVAVVIFIHKIKLLCISAHYSLDRKIDLNGPV